MDYNEKIEYIKKLFGNKFIDKNKRYLYRFWEKVDVKDELECWNWIACTNRYGYGIFQIGCYTYRSHRMAYIFTKGPIADNKIINHICNNRSCCNPNHLKMGSNIENSIYMIECNRQAKGESHGNSIYKEDVIRDIHKIYQEQTKQHPTFKQWQITEPLVRKYNISQNYINNILAGRCWYHIYEEFHKYDIRNKIVKN